jgi:hypothetical protein
MNLKVEFCDHQAAKYACINWHYSKSIPAGKLVKFGVWENDKYIGCVLYGRGACNNLAKSLSLKVTECCELVRVALTKHKAPVSKIMAITLLLLKKQCPGLRAIVSFADSNKNHHGGIYQATNWIYIGKTDIGDSGSYIINGKLVHGRSVGSAIGSRAMNNVKKHYGEKVSRYASKGKHKYIYVLDKSIREKFLKIQKPYPKRPKQAMAIPIAQRQCNADQAAPSLRNEC